MSDSLLKSLRDQVLDESQTLAGLLRKCLMLGAVTGSDALRHWAESELNGYDEVGTVPKYRFIPAPAIKIDYQSYSGIILGQTKTKLEFPLEAQKHLLDSVPMHQPIEELERICETDGVSFSHPTLTLAMMIWNDELDEYNKIFGIRYSPSSVLFVGLVSQVRTQLVSIVADLTSSTPMSELPKKEAVDAVMTQHIGAQYITSIETANAPIAVGENAEASTHGVTLDEVIQMLETAQLTVKDEAIDDTELVEAIDDLRAALVESSPSTDEVVQKVGRLRKASGAIVVPSLSAAVGGAVQSVTTLVMSGAFG